ncbi:MAG: hypothetical protein GAK43_02530 [Stenotrophomonas maltophilia]|nr:MAG: hypothetical protein GAK43_02530 [Stenotrophomonas maltophilia]
MPSEPFHAAAPDYTAISDTLRIPLAARALGDALFPALAVGDAFAREAMQRLEDDGQMWLKDRQSVYGVLKRTRIFRDLAGAYLRRHPGGHVVNLGCGLSQYFQWLDNGQARITDADLPDVIQQRLTLFGAPGERQRVLELDLCEPDWWGRLGLPASRDAEPLFLMCAGVLMYLQPAVVLAVLAEFGERAPAGSVLAFDCMCWLAAGRARRHPSVRHTQAEFAWGPRRLAELSCAHPRLRPPQVHKVMEGYGLPYNLFGPVFRALFGVPFYALYALQVADTAADHGVSA